MTAFLGIDVGLNKTGIARSSGNLAQPLTVVRETDNRKLIEKIRAHARENQTELVVVGMPEGKLAAVAKRLGMRLRERGFRVVFWDETLTTEDAIRLSIEAGVPRKKRRELEDAFAAAVMLQSYIDAHRV